MSYSIAYTGMLAVLFLLAPKAAHACDCLIPDSPTVERDQADAVFAGRVLSVTRFDDRNAVVIDVSKGWKGDTEERMIIWTTTNGGAACGYHFERDTSYLIYAHGTQGYGLNVSICSRTRALADADEDLAALGAGEAFSGGLCGGPDSLAMLQGVLFVALAFPLFRRRRYSSMT
ncbi:MAG: hypothetical protein SH809_02925 [Rhodothermales bacterium]|nr:hypothetical protein [Rhodothermales bacterium]